PTEFREYVKWRETGVLPAKDEAPPPETAAAVEAPQVETEPQAGAEETQQEPEEEEVEPGRPNGRERRINRLTRGPEELKRQPAAATQPRPPEAPAKPPAPPGKPKLEDFETLEAYQESLTDWKIDQRDAQRAIQSAEEKLQTAWSSSEKTARAAHAAYDEIVHSASAPEGPGVPAARQAMLEDEAGAEILYHLATHPDELKRIAALPPVAAVMAIGPPSAAVGPPPAWK